MSKEDLKITKYITRLRNSFDNDDISKSLEYLQHLKFHVQKGGVKTGIQDKLNSLQDLINNFQKPEYNIKTLKEAKKKALEDVEVAQAEATQAKAATEAARKAQVEAEATACTSRDAEKQAKTEAQAKVQEAAEAQVALAAAQEKVQEAEDAKTETKEKERILEDKLDNIINEITQVFEE